MVRRAFRVVDGGKDRLLTVRETAERLGVSRWAVYALADTGALPHVRVSNSIRIAPADLTAFVEAHRTGEAP